MLWLARLMRREVLAVADGEVDLDGVELRDGGEDGLRADEIADLRGGLAGDSRDERADLGEAEVELGVGDRGLCGGDRGLGRGDGGFGLRGLLFLVVELALRDGVFRGERRVAVDVDLRELKLRLSLTDGSLGLAELALRPVAARPGRDADRFRRGLGPSGRRSPRGSSA